MDSNLTEWREWVKEPPSYNCCKFELRGIKNSFWVNSLYSEPFNIFTFRNSDVMGGGKKGRRRDLVLAKDSRCKAIRRS